MVYQENLKCILFLKFDWGIFKQLHIKIFILFYFLINIIYWVKKKNI